MRIHSSFFIPFGKYELKPAEMNLLLSFYSKSLLFYIPGVSEMENVQIHNKKVNAS